MTTLADYISVNRPDIRSVSLEHDLGAAEPLDAYSPPVNALQLLDAINSATSAGPRVRAWSVIGPYGAGKSTFAHLLAGVFGRTDDPAHASALKAIRGVDRSLANRLRRTRSRLGLDEQGAILACVTARNEPLSVALARALERGVRRYWTHRRGPRPAVVKEIERLQKAGANARGAKVREAFDELVAHVPVLLLVDEFGTLLHSEASVEAPELYLMQLLAERVSNVSEFAGLIVTLQHLSFEESTSGLSPIAREEWRKVEGRFEPRVFDANPSHAVSLIARSLDQRSVPGPHRRAASKEIDRLSGVADKAGIPRELLGNLGTYPLHPIVPPVAAGLAGRLGQHDRSLAAFIASDAPSSVLGTLPRVEVSERKPAFIGLDVAYDYFVTVASLSELRAGGERYREIHDRILDADRLNDLELRTLKAIGALNLVGGPELRASRRLLELACGPRSAVQAALRSLVANGLVTYRRFADEYRVWEGSDFDVGARIEERRQQLAVGSERELLLRLAVRHEQPRPLVARRHSHRTCTLRFFESRYVASLDAADEVTTESDGLLIYVFGKLPEEIPAQTSDGRPVVVIGAGSLRTAGRAALDLAAALEAFDESPELDRDPVARGEMRHRLTSARQAFSAALRDAIDPGRRNVGVFAAGERLKRIPPHGGLERVLSDLCDRTYGKTPAINSEMLNRRELTSQGAKARRALLSAMLEQAGEARLGFEGYGPERAMLGSALVAPGIYREREGKYRFGPPPSRSTLAPVWRELMRILDRAEEDALGVDELYARLQTPPYGMKLGPLPVLIAAALLVRDEDVLLFEAGSYVPRIGPEHLERLVKSPHRFSVKRLPADALRSEVFARIGEAVGGVEPSGRDSRNQGALALLRPMMSVVRGLSEYALATRRISPTAQRVRAALLDTREPDELLFVELPRACGLESFRSELEPNDAGAFSSALGGALLELADAQPELTRHIEAVLAEVFELDTARLREGLAKRASGLEQHVIEPKMRSFVLLAQDDSMDHPDWLDGLAMNLADRPPRSWSDADIATFEAMAAERARWLTRLRLLFDGGQGDGGGAPQLTLTMADGREATRLLDVSAEVRESVSSDIDGMLQSLRERHGPEAIAAALEVLAERILQVDEEADIPSRGSTK